MALTANINLYATGKQTSVLDQGTATFPFAISTELAFTDGTTAGKADRIFADTRTLAASGTENLDLAGVLTDAYGATITFVTIKALLIKAAAGNTNDVQLTRPAANGVPLFLAASDGIPIRPGGIFAWACTGTGIAVTAATGDLITLTNSAGGTGVTYDVMIVGTSA